MDQISYENIKNIMEYAGLITENTMLKLQNTELRHIAFKYDEGMASIERMLVNWNYLLKNEPENIIHHQAVIDTIEVIKGFFIIEKSKGENLQVKLNNPTKEELEAIRKSVKSVFGDRYEEINTVSINKAQSPEPTVKDDPILNEALLEATKIHGIPYLHENKENIKPGPNTLIEENIRSFNWFYDHFQSIANLQNEKYSVDIFQKSMEDYFNTCDPKVPAELYLKLKAYCHIKKEGIIL